MPRFCAFTFRSENARGTQTVTMDVKVLQLYFFQKCVLKTNCSNQNESVNKLTCRRGSNLSRHKVRSPVPFSLAMSSIPRTMSLKPQKQAVKGRGATSDRPDRMLNLSQPTTTFRKLKLPQRVEQTEANTAEAENGVSSTLPM